MLLDLPNVTLTPLLDEPVMEVRYAFGELVAVMPDGSVTATPFDIGKRRVSGRATPIATGVMSTGTGIAQFAVAENGTIAYIPETPRSLVLIGRNGQSETLITERLNVHARASHPTGNGSRSTSRRRRAQRVDAVARPPNAHAGHVRS
jgi:hypothetical protein